MKLDEEKLRQKGWHENDIQYTKNIIKHAEENKQKKIIILEKIAIWLVIISVIGAAIAGAWIIEPLLIVLNKTGALIAIGISGLFFGTIMSYSIKKIEVLEKHHHRIISIIIPISAIITSILITKQAMKIIEIANIHLEHNPIALGITYVITTLIPYIILIYYERIKNGSF